MAARIPALLCINQVKFLSPIPLLASLLLDDSSSSMNYPPVSLYMNVLYEEVPKTQKQK